MINMSVENPLVSVIVPVYNTEEYLEECLDSIISQTLEDIEIKDGRVRITDSPCPNKTCISQGWHNPLVCLPNKVMISVEGETSVKAGGSQEVELDAVSE